jgi:hypothetical protein
MDTVLYSYSSSIDQEVVGVVLDVRDSYNDLKMTRHTEIIDTPEILNSDAHNFLLLAREMLDTKIRRI